MDIKVYDLLVPQFVLALEAMKGTLKKAQAHADAKKIDSAILLQQRLISDQFSLLRQVQIACDGAKFGVARLTGREAPKFEDKETTMAELFTRIDKTIGFIKETKAEDFKDYRAKKASFPWNPGKYLEGQNYLVQHAIPNFYFHVTTAYAILRSQGVDIGKADYLGNQAWKAE